MDTQTTPSTLSDDTAENTTDTAAAADQQAPLPDDDLLPFYFLSMAGSY